jgi:hypothetical protein
VLMQRMSVLGRLGAKVSRITLYSTRRTRHALTHHTPHTMHSHTIPHTPCTHTPCTHTPYPTPHTP